MTGKTDTPGCFIFLVIIVGLVFWQVSLVLIFIGIVIALLGALQNQTYGEHADKWSKLHNGSSCSYRGKYGFIERVSVDGNKVTLSVKPVCALLPGSLASSDSFSIKIVDGSFQHAMRQLFKQDSIEFLQGVSVELSAIESALKCHEQFQWCVKSMNSLVKMSDQINHALSVANGNPLLEPSIPAMENAKSRITEESFSITKAKEFAFETLKDLIDYLSVPEELRQPCVINELDITISIRDDDLKSSFNELLQFNNEYIKLLH